MKKENAFFAAEIAEHAEVRFFSAISAFSAVDTIRYHFSTVGVAPLIAAKFLAKLAEFARIIVLALLMPNRQQALRRCEEPERP